MPLPQKKLALRMALCRQVSCGHFRKNPIEIMRMKKIISFFNPSRWMDSQWAHNVYKRAQLLSREYVPPSIRENIGSAVKTLVKNGIKYCYRGQHTPDDNLTTYIVSGSWWEEHHARWQSLLSSGRPILVVGGGRVVPGKNMTVITNPQFKDGVLSSVVTNTAIEIFPHADPRLVTGKTLESLARKVAKTGVGKSHDSFRILSNRELMERAQWILKG